MKPIFRPVITLTLGLWMISSAVTAQVVNRQHYLPANKLSVIRGITNPEDLVAIPATRWLIASGMAPHSGLHLINIEKKTVERWTAPRASGPSPLKSIYKDGIQPEPDELQAHGLSLRDQGNGHSLLYVVNHGGQIPFTDLAKGRETVEVFDVDLTQAKPTLAWLGSVPMPDGLVANAVVADSGGAIYVTVALHPGFSPNDLWTNKPTGAVYRWEPGSAGFNRIVGTELTGNNGIELAKDGQTLYVVHMRGISKFSNTNPAIRLNTTRIAYGLGDNIHWSGDRLLIAASRLENCPATGPGFGCMMGYHVSYVDPGTLTIDPLVFGGNPAHFGGASVGILAAGKLWLGSFNSDGIAYTDFPEKRKSMWQKHVKKPRE